MKKRIISLLTSFVMICSLVVVMPSSDVNAYTSHTQQEALNWVRSQVGKGIDYDGVYGNQCVDLIKAYYAYLGVSPVNGNGADYVSNSLPSGWQRIKDAVPQPGDILVYTSGYGHVAIYEAERITYHQNFDSHQYVEKITYRYNGLTNPYWGVIRPDFNNHTHNYSSSITKQPTCTATGVKTYICSCGNSYTETIAAKGHSYVNKVVAPTSTEKGYTLHTCSVCGNIYKDGYVNPPELKEDGWYYCDVLPSDVSSDKYTVQYNNYYEKTQSTSPGSDWTNAGVVKNEWQNSGSQYTSPYDLETSDSRVLVRSVFYHFCIPGAGKNSEGNYEMSGNFSHYDEVDPKNVSANYCGDDNGHPYYLLYWADGNAVYCRSGDTCDGSWGTHGYRCRAWYKENTYQDRVKIVVNKYTKNSGWVSSKDSSAKSVKIRYKSKECTHTFSSWTTTKSATCTTDGTQTRKCSVCGKTETKVIAKTGHKYTEKIVQPTKSAQGYTLHTCSVCGNSYKDNYTSYVTEETDEPQLTIDTVTACAGDSVTVRVLLENNPGIISLRFNVEYDPNVLTLEKAVEADFSPTTFAPINKEPFTILWSDSIHGNNKTNGIVAELTFKVKENAANGEYPIKISYDDDEIFNDEMKNISFKTVNGAVNVSSHKPGDVNGDGKVNMKDYALLQQYLNNWDVTIIKAAADVNGDGKINMKDYALLQQYLNGWDVVLK